MSTLIIKSGTTSIEGAIVKGSFSYFSGSTTDLGPTDVTGFYSGIDAPNNGYTVYQIGSNDGWTARVATDDASLNSILIDAGGTGSTVNQHITWATNTNSVFINNGDTVILVSYYMGGFFTTYSGVSQNYLVKLDSNFSKDTSFDIGTGFNTAARSILIQSDEKIVVGGSFITFTGATQNRLIRLNTDGSKDTSFDIGTGFNNVVNGIAIQSDGKILVTGNFTTFTGATQNRLIRLNTDGSKDTSFNIGTGFGNQATSIAIQSDGKIIVGGGFTSYNGELQNRLVRINSDGSRDTSFNTGTGPGTPIVNVVSVQSDEKILVGGQFTTFNGASQNYFVRLNSDGSKDTSFDIGTGFNGNVSSIVIQSDGKILASGAFTTYQGITATRSILLNQDGSINNTTASFNNTVLTSLIK